jgi:hypothetical protein
MVGLTLHPRRQVLAYNNTSTKVGDSAFATKQIMDTFALGTADICRDLASSLKHDHVRGGWRPGESSICRSSWENSNTGILLVISMHACMHLSVDRGKCSQAASEIMLVVQRAHMLSTNFLCSLFHWSMCYKLWYSCSCVHAFSRCHDMDAGISRIRNLVKSLPCPNILFL